MPQKEFATAVEIFADEQQIPTEIEILAEGRWKDTPNHPDFEVAASDIDEYATNFKAGVRKGVPIDIEHRTDKKYGGEAAGWLKDVYTTVKADGKKALMGVVDWNDTGKDVLANKKYKFASAEFIPRGYQDPEGQLPSLNNVLKAVTLTNFPLMKGLTPVVASDAQKGEGYRLMEPIITAEEGEKSVQLDQIRTKDASALTEEEKTFLSSHKDELSAAEQTKFSLAEAPAKQEEVPAPAPAPAAAPAAAPVAATDGTVAISASELNELKAMAAKGVAASEQLRNQAARQVVEGHIKRGALKADQLDSTVELLIKADENGTSDLIKAHLDALPENKLVTAGEVGEGPKGAIGSAADALNTKAEEIMASEKVSYADALKKAARVSADLAKNYDKE